MDKNRIFTVTCNLFQNYYIIIFIIIMAKRRITMTITMMIMMIMLITIPLFTLGSINSAVNSPG